MKLGLNHGGFNAKSLYSSKVSPNIDQIIPFVILMFVIIGTNCLLPGVFSLDWIGIKTDATMTLIFVTIGQTLVFLIGGMDMSVGGVMSLANCFSVVYMKDSPQSIILVSLTVLAFGLLAGMFNGLIVVKLKLQPFIATLATWSIWLGVAMCILPIDGGQPPQSFVNILLARPFGISISLIIVVALIIIGIIFKTTRFGISIIATGGNEKGAFYGGINTNRIQITVYALSGLFAAMAGLFRTAQVASGSPTAGSNFVLASCAAAVIGGVSLKGGKGSFAGAIVGAFILQMLTDLLVFAGISSYWTAMFQGLLLILAVGFISIISMVRDRNSVEV